MHFFKNIFPNVSFKKLYCFSVRRIPPILWTKIRRDLKVTFLYILPLVYVLFSILIFFQRKSNFLLKLSVKKKY